MPLDKPSQNLRLDVSPLFTQRCVSEYSASYVPVTLRAGVWRLTLFSVHYDSGEENSEVLI